MKQLFAFMLAAAVAAPSLAFARDAEAKFGPLLTAAELQAAQSSVDPLLVDIRGKDKKGVDPFVKGHIAGSVSAPYGLFRGPKDNPGALISEEKLEEVLRAIGVTKDRPVVVVYEGKDVTDFGAAARVYWTLKSSGVSQLAILNGGLKSWSEAGLPLEEGASAPTPSEIDIEFSEEWLATTDDVLAAIDGSSDAVLVDARPEEFWKGEKKHKLAARSGTLPGSADLPHSSFFEDKSTTISATDKVKAVLAKAGVGGENGGAKGEIVSFCNTGHWAATSWFAMSELGGVDGVKLYAESLVGYAADKENPLENEPAK